MYIHIPSILSSEIIVGRLTDRLATASVKERVRRHEGTQILGIDGEQGTSYVGTSSTSAILPISDLPSGSALPKGFTQSRRTVMFVLHLFLPGYNTATCHILHYLPQTEKMLPPPHPLAWVGFRV